MSTISSACWAPLKLLTSRFLAKLALAVAAAVVLAMPVMPISVAGAGVPGVPPPPVMVPAASRVKSLSAFSDARVILPVASTLALRPVSPICLLMPLATAVATSEAVAPAFQLMSSMVTPLSFMPETLPSLVAAAAAVVAATSAVNLTLPSEPDLASMTLSMAIA